MKFVLNNYRQVAKGTVNAFLLHCQTLFKNILQTSKTKIFNIIIWSRFLPVLFQYILSFNTLLNYIKFFKTSLIFVVCYGSKHRKHRNSNLNFFQSFNEQ